ncbi:hypothetical protein EDD15DRAFT_2310184 [Pisolithus albus]|nr:hypothetical protein EDD15DRAFT_2310184 [Pisolithus albus]
MRCSSYGNQVESTGGSLPTTIFSSQDSVPISTPGIFGQGSWKSCDACGIGVLLLLLEVGLLFILYPPGLLFSLFSLFRLLRGLGSLIMKKLAVWMLYIFIKRSHRLVSATYP